MEEYSDLAEENLQKKNGFSIREFAEHKTKKTIGEEDEENLAVAFVNSGAKKILDTDEDILVYEKGEEKGFKFSLGKFSIESTR